MSLNVNITPHSAVYGPGYRLFLRVELPVRHVVPSSLVSHFKYIVKGLLLMTCGLRIQQQPDQI